MKLTEIAIERVKANRDCINTLALGLGAHAGSIDRNLKENKEDGTLTKAKAVDIIHKETGLSKNKILTKE